MTKPEVRQSGIVDVTFGQDVTIVQPVNLYGCAIGDGSFIGPFVEIQKGATVGSVAEFNPTLSFVSLSRLATIALSPMEPCLSTTFSRMAVRRLSERLGKQLALVTMLVSARMPLSCLFPFAITW